MDRARKPDRLARAVHRTLLAGVVASGAILGLGLLLLLMQHNPPPPGKATLLPAMLHAAAGGNPIAMLNVGLLVLVATPILRVIVLGVGWLARRQWHEALVALVVAALLAVSLVVGVG